MARFFWICLGGAVGTGARHVVSEWAPRVFGTSFPYGTLAVNVIGSLLIAALMYLANETSSLPPTLRLALTTGVLGGFTTYSTFSYETLKYLQAGEPGKAALNVVLSVLVCLAACFLGWEGARWLVSLTR